MKKVTPEPNWPETWKYSYPYDLMEIYGDMTSPGYAYAYTNRMQHTLDFVRKIAKPGAKILDVAGAQGNFTLSLAELGYEVTWNDLRKELADYVKLKWEKGTINFVPGNVFELGFDANFDIVLIAEIIEHVAHPDEFLIKISQMLKPGGYIVMTTPNGEYFLNTLPKFSDCPDPSQFEAKQFQPNAEGHIFLLHLDEVELLASRSGLSVIEKKFFNNFLTNGHIKLRNILKFIPKLAVNASEKLTLFLPRILQRKLNAHMAVVFAKTNSSLV